MRPQPHRSWDPSALVGRRVELRPHGRASLSAFLRWYANPEITRLTRHQPGPMAREEITRFFESRVIGPDSLALAVHLRRGDRLIGTCAFSQLDVDNGSVNYHITIGEPDAWGHGYGTEATDLMLEHAFERLGVHRVALSVFAFNDRAIRAYRRSGFTTEGRSREGISRDGRYWDEIHMSILAHEWAERGRAGSRSFRAGGAVAADSVAVSAGAGSAAFAGVGPAASRRVRAVDDSLVDVLGRR